MFTIIRLLKRRLFIDRISRSARARVCVCVRACVRACVRVCVCVCVCVKAREKNPIVLVIGDGCKFVLWEPTMFTLTSERLQLVIDVNRRKCALSYIVCIMTVTVTLLAV